MKTKIEQDSAKLSLINVAADALAKAAFNNDVTIEQLLPLIISIAKKKIAIDKI